MCKIFDVELSAQGRCTELALPAAPWSMQDALEKLKLREDESLHCEILRIHSCGALYPYLKHANALFELNALCQQLALLDEAQISILEGLVKMEYGQHDAQPAPLSQLIDMACSTDCCHFLAGITTDVQLGRFCAENGFVPEVDDLPNMFFEMLNFEQIGLDFRQNEGGVFTSGGYVQKHDELRQVYKCYNRTQHKTLCDGPTTYRAEKVDAVVGKLLRDVFERVRAVDESELLQQQLQSSTVQCKQKLQKAQADHAKAARELAKWEDMMLDAIDGLCVFSAEQVRRRMDTVQEKVDVLNEEIRILREQVEQTELVAGEIQASHRRLLSWADMFDTASAEEKKMIASYLIKAVTLTHGYGIQVEFNVSEAQYLGGMEMG